MRRKAIAAGDLHWEEGPRWEECLRVHGWIAELVREERPDAFLCPGDVYERASTPLEREAVAEWITSIAEVCPVVIARGNHDARRDCALLARLRTHHPVIVEEAAGVHHVGGINVMAVAWPSRASLAAMIGSPLEGEGVDQVARDTLRNVFLGLREQAENLAPGSPTVLLGHFMIDGSELSNGQPLCGASLNVGLADLALAGADVVIAGHIHKAQEWLVDNNPVLYTGSPYRHDFGEHEQKSVTILRFDGGLVDFERARTPARGMVLFETRWLEGGGFDWHTFAAPHPDERHGAEIRMRYHVAADQREAAKAAAAAVRDEWLRLGAAIVQVEERVIAETRARVPEVQSAASVAEQLEVLWRARGFNPGPRRESLLSKLRITEDEARAQA